MVEKGNQNENNPFGGTPEKEKEKTPTGPEWQAHAWAGPDSGEGGFKSE